MTKHHGAAVFEAEELDAIRLIGLVEPPDPEVLEQARMVLEARYANAEQARRVRRRAVLLLAAAAVAVAATVAPTVLPFGRGGAPMASADAAAFLRSVATRAGEQHGDWRDAAFWYSKSRYDRGNGPVVREIWIGRRATGRLLDAGVGAGKIALLANKSGVQANKSGVPAGKSGGADASIPIEANPAAWDELWTLPTDPAALEQALRTERAGQGPDPDSELFTAIGDLLRESPAPPSLRAALYEVAARVPQVRLVGEVTDAVGRRGVAVERGQGALYQRYIIDPTDGRLLEEQEGAGASPAWRSTYLEQGPVADDHAYPAARN